MSWYSLGAFLKNKDKVLDRFLATPLRPMNLCELATSNPQYIPIAVEQLGARTARCYRAICSDVLKSSLDCETAARLLSLQSICKREFECCVALKEAADACIGQLESGEIGELFTAKPKKISDDAEAIINGEWGGGNCGSGFLSSSLRSSPGARFVELLESLGSLENVLDVVVNEKSIRSPVLNNWVLCFCRRRVSWRVIHGHLLHLIRPKRHSPIIRKDCGVGGILQHTSTVVVDLYSRVAQAAHGGSMTVKVEEQPDLFSCPPSGRLATSSGKAGVTHLSRPTPSAPASSWVYSVEGHLEYVFRELIKNACVAMLVKTASIDLKVRFASDDTHVVVDVTDSAGGLDSEAVENLWLFGWTSNPSLGNSMGGFGVGLPASKVYMDLWGGRIDLYTTTGVGTTARVLLPKAPTEVLVPRRKMFPFL